MGIKMCRLLQELQEKYSARQGVKVIIYEHYMTAAPNLLSTRDDFMEGVFSMNWGYGLHCLNPMCVQMGFCLLVWPGS